MKRPLIDDSAWLLWWFPKLSETFVVEELRAMAEAGHAVEIIAISRPSGEPGNPRTAELIDRVTWMDEIPLLRAILIALSVVARHPMAAARSAVFVLKIKSRWTALNFWYGLLVAHEVERRGIKYLHAHFAGDPGEVAFFAGRLSGARWGVTVHAVEIYYNRFLCPKLAEASLVATVCEYNVNQITQRCPSIGPNDLVRKLAGLDPSMFSGDAAPGSADEFRILSIGRLVPKKGLSLLLDAVAALREMGHPVQCTIIGSGPLEEQLKQQRAELGLDDSVTMVGSMPPAEVRDLLLASTVLAAPCTIDERNGDRDSMPVVIKEAMAAGVPVVASDDFGIPEMVDPSCGVLFERDSLEGCIEALGTVIAMSPGERAAMGSAGKQAVRQFDERRLVPVLIDAINALDT